MEAKTALVVASKKLSSSKIENSRFEAEFLLSFVLGKPREFLLAHDETTLSETELAKFDELIEKRASHEPIAHLTKNKEFFGLDFQVSKDTLVPRPETEMMVEEGVAIAKQHTTSPLLVSDIGTGSGCIITSLATELEKQKASLDKTIFSASDISKMALKVCKQNLKKHNLAKKVILLEGSLLSPIFEEELLQDKDTFLVLANLPYLSDKVYLESPKTVREFEPKSALFSEEKGLWHYKELLEQLQGIKKANPKLKTFALLEISPEQKEDISKLILEFFPKQKANFEIKKDLAQKWRMVKLVIF